MSLFTKTPHATREEVKQIAGFFPAMQLPVPEEQEDAYRTRDGGRIVFLTPYGCTVRVIEKHRHFRLLHPNCLRPLLKRAIGNYVIEINPGMEMSVTDQDIANTMRKLNAAGVSYSDPTKNNFGFIPGSDRSFPVIIDLDGTSLPLSYDELNNSVAAAKKLLERKDPQEELYGDLRRSFEKAWPEDADKPHAPLVRENWKACLELRHKGLLRSDWEGNTYRDIGTLSQRYADKLQQHRTAGLIP